LECAFWVLAYMVNKYLYSLHNSYGHQHFCSHIQYLRILVILELD